MGSYLKTVSQESLFGLLKYHEITATIIQLLFKMNLNGKNTKTRQLL
mgnify:CR=1 FL=1